MILSTATLTGVTAKPSLIEDIDFFLGSDSSGYALADKLRNINAWHYDVTTLILASMSDWEWDDTNKTDYPIGTTTLVAGQRDYTLPSNLLQVIRIEVLDAAGNYQKLQEFDESQIRSGLSEFMETNGLPTYYRTTANAIELYPAPAAGSVTTAAGLKVYYVRTQTEFTTSDAAVSPGFAPQFHRFLSLGAAWDYAVAKGLPQANFLKLRIEEMKKDIQEFYATRNLDVRPSLQARRRSYN